jgi:plasmid stabilization system protein ParE
VHLAPRALKDAEDIYGYIAREAPVAAEHWVAELFEVIESLARFPRRCAPATEEPVLRVGLRQMVFGNYRILFTVDEEARVVNVPHIRHGARRLLEPGDLDES